MRLATLLAMLLCASNAYAQQPQQPQPRTVLVPQVQYVPMRQYQYVQPIEYRTPLRNLFFGRSRVWVWYQPIQPQPQGVRR